MKILAISQSKDILGGANRSFIDVLSLLKKDYGHEIIALTPGEGQCANALMKRGICSISAKYHQVSFVHLNDFKDCMRFFYSSIRDIQNIKYAYGLKKVLENKHFDIIYINDTTNTIGYYLSQTLHLPFVWHFRGYHESIKRYMIREKDIRSKPNGTIIAISYAMKQYMVEKRKMNPNNIIVIHNGVSNAGVTIVQPWSKTIRGEVHCLHCGHLSEAKGQKESILAISELKKRGYGSVFLHLAGSPLVSHGKSYKDELLQLVDDLGVNENVIFEGEVANMAVFRERMNIELICSLAEPFGRVTVEGMQAGLVVIGCNTGATPEIITDQVNGLLYSQGDYKDLATKIESVISDVSLGDRLSANALKTTKESFLMDDNVRQINDVICQQVRRNNE